MKRLIATILLCALGLCPLAWANDFNLPRLGEAGANAVSQSELNTMGRQALRQIRGHGLLLGDPLVHAYIRSMGRRLVSHSKKPDDPINYYVIQAPVINAFALPGKKVFMFTGLFLKTNTENELAGVMAHESAHVIQRHIARQIADSQHNAWKAIAAMLAGLAVASQTGNSQVAIAAISGTQGLMMAHQISFTRHQEAEADHVGINILARARYNPDGMAKMFEKLDLLSRGNLQPPAFLLNHPLNRVRITSARQRAQQLPAVKHPSSLRYYLMKARVRALTTQHAKQTLKYFNTRDSDKQNARQRVATQYGKAFMLTRLKQPQKAIPIIHALLAQHADVVALHLALANAYYHQARYDKAIAVLKNTQAAFPDNIATQLDYAQTLLAAHKPSKARRLMKNAYINHPGNLQVLSLLAQSANKAGRKGEGHYYLSELYQHYGRIMPAITQIQLALAAPDLSDYDTTRYQARLDQLKKQHKQHKRRRH